jgi:DNA-binding NtrC family response regulator
MKPYNGNIVILDDEEGMCRALTKLLTIEGFHVTTFQRGPEALEYLARHAADIVLTDMRMPGMTGREMLEEVRTREIAVELIVMTAFGTIEQAIECVRAGAYDYVTKPLNHSELLVSLRRAMETKRLRDMNRALSSAYGGGSQKQQLLGVSPAIAAVREMIDRVAPTDSPVLITGESGTGKELAARSVHQRSRRAGGRFVAINCGAIPETLIESELFGHERGAFTGATDTKLGLVEVADGGTLFLDEIGELPLLMQAKLLRVLQEYEITRVGGVVSIPVNIRVVAATNRNLVERITEGLFREDLYYRLDVIKIEMPSLRARTEDVALLAEAQLAQLATRYERPGLRFSDGAVAALAKREYPGNVRELNNVVERLVVMSSGDVLLAETMQVFPGAAEKLPPQAHAVGAPLDQVADTARALADGDGDFKEARDQFEREYLRALLRRHGGSVTAAARASGIARRSFYEKMEKLGISTDEAKDEA